MKIDIDILLEIIENWVEKNWPLPITNVYLRNILRYYKKVKEREDEMDELMEMSWEGDPFNYWD